VKIAIANGNRRRVGGIETYLATVIPELAKAGHELRLWHDFDEPEDRQPIAPKELLPSWSLARDPLALPELRRWRPDLIFCHGLTNPAVEDEMLAVAPGVFLAHAYVGTCVSGAKAFKRPVVEPCSRIFGPACLGQYYPRRCGGLSPITMIRQYLLQSRRLEVLRHFQAIIVASSHMAQEYGRHGLANRTKVVELPVANPGAEAAYYPTWSASHCELLYLGRLELLKGGQHFLEALPEVHRLLGRSVRVTFAGDGPAMTAWQARAHEISRQAPGIQIVFTGWVDAVQRADLLRHTHLLVMPSVWPEPFGLAGVEAAFFGVPAAAFRTGGIESWLGEGVTGRLAPATPPNPTELALAIADCLRHETTYRQLSQGAKQMSGRFSLATHLAKLKLVFEKAVQRS
jgi:glycosyltransferase involved in cell wall biosynthesis